MSNGDYNERPDGSLQDRAEHDGRDGGISTSSSNKCPEPPLGWQAEHISYDVNPHDEEPSSTKEDIPDGDASWKSSGPDALDSMTGLENELNRARKFVIGSQAAAIVSLFIGGVVLSAVAVGLAVYGYRRTCAVVESQVKDENLRAALKRSGAVAIAMTSVALAVNAVMLVLYYPTYVEILQQYGLYGSTPNATSQGAAASPNPGGSLFG